MLSEIGAPLVGVVGADKVGVEFSQLGGDEEAPQDLTYGENWAYFIVDAVLKSPAWERTLLIYTFDEHGGYYDHVPPPKAIAPDDIKPDLTKDDVKGGYTVYGPRVPAIVASPYSKPNAVTNVVHDHTSVLATIEAKWNLPAMTYRDANAETVMDFLDLKRKAFKHSPTIAKPARIPSRTAARSQGWLMSLVGTRMARADSHRCSRSACLPVLQRRPARAQTLPVPRCCHRSSTSGSSCWRTRTTPARSVTLLPIRTWPRRCRARARC